ncbi:helix-turn-helix domain-containing protein [Confluentibacter sediminis]|uniref:helix-turn-helix domain-containing protein n=1 Tax=Confluentibacter sediminis TaxID=2219045 RepID=UPI000DAE9ED3|nr:AraC family transcriptional regulator [Confluentibacter sediminis]
MNFKPIDIIHILTIFVQIPLIGVLLYKGHRSVSNKLMVFFFFAQILSSVDMLFWLHFDITLKLYPFLAYICTPFFLVWGPTMYLYIKSETTNPFVFKRKYLLHYLPFALLSIYFLAFYHFHSLEEKREILNSQELFNLSFRKILSVITALQVLVYNITSIITLEHFSKETKVKSSHFTIKMQWNRFIIYGYFITCLCNNVAGIVYFTSGFKETSTYLLVTILLYFLYFSIILVKALLGSHLGEQTKTSKNLLFSKDDVDNLNNLLESFMNEKKPYLEFNLTLSELASKMKIKERQLSQFINACYQTSFQDYINGFRIEEAKRLIKQNKNSGKTILEIVYESGFNSKSAFNFAFKKHTKTTPTLYKKSLK